MGLGLLALALAAVPRGREGRPPLLDLGPHGERWRRLARYASAAVLTAAAVSIGLLFLSDLRARCAHRVRAPRRAALRGAAGGGPEPGLDRAPLPAGVRAGEPGSDGGGARGAAAGLSQEPDNFVTLALLGDLEVRADRRQVARDYYRRASEQTRSTSA